MNEPAQLIVPAERVERSGRQVAQIPEASEQGGLQSLMRVIERASLDPNFDVDKLQKLLEIRERWEAGEARKAFAAAMSEFKQNAPQIVKDSHVSFTNKSGTLTEYDHASLFAVCNAVISGLAAAGISHRWVPDQSGQKIKVTCILTHVAGHSESTTMESAPDDSGGKSSIQAIASAVSYLQRYTLLGAVGMATKEMDDDARKAAGPTETINERQIADLIALCTEVGADKDKFLRMLKVKDLAEIQTASYPMVVALLEAKRKR